MPYEAPFLPLLVAPHVRRSVLMPKRLHLDILQTTHLECQRSGYVFYSVFSNSVHSLSLSPETPLLVSKILQSFSDNFFTYLSLLSHRLLSLKSEWHQRLQCYLEGGGTLKRWDFIGDLQVIGNVPLAGIVGLYLLFPSFTFCPWDE